MGWPGARAEFERLVDEHLPAALGFAVRLTNSPETAEELVQEAMLAASRHWRSFRGESSFRTWLFRILVNAHRDQLRRRRELAPLPGDLEDGQQPEPLEAAAASELGRAVADRVAKLPPRQREVLVLAVYERVTVSEIARILEISTGNVHATLHLARKRLRRELEPYLTKS